MRRLPLFSLLFLFALFLKTYVNTCTVDVTYASKSRCFRLLKLLKVENVYYLMNIVIIVNEFVILLISVSKYKRPWCFFYNS